MTFQNKQTGDHVVAWQWDGKDQISLAQMLFSVPYTVEGETAVIDMGDGGLLRIEPGTYIVNGPHQGELQTLSADIFKATYDRQTEEL